MSVLFPAFLLLVLIECRPKLLKNNSQDLTTSAFANVGSTVCLWFFTKTLGFTPSGERKWHNTAPSPCSTRNQQRNGRFLGLLQTVSTIKAKQWKHTALAWLFASHQKHSRASSQILKKTRTPEKLLRL